MKMGTDFNFSKILNDKMFLIKRMPELDSLSMRSFIKLQSISQVIGITEDSPYLTSEMVHGEIYEEYK